MIRPLVFLPLLALSLLPSHTSAASAQASRRASPSKTNAPQAAAADLSSLSRHQQQALTAGDPARIAETSRALAAYLLRDAAQLRLVQNRSTEAPDLDRESLTLVDSPATHLDLATALLRSGQAPEALKEVSAVVASDPRDLPALRLQGTILRSAGDDRGAIQAFTHALELQSDVNIAYALAAAYLGAHDKPKAQEIFTRIIANSGNAAIWHVAIGDAYREALYFDDAVLEFKKAIAIDPRAGHAEFFLGFTYLQLNQWGPSSQSFEHLRAAVRLAPHEYASNFYLGALESTDGSDLPSSNRHLQTAAQANPASPEVWLYLGLNAVRAKDTTAAKLYLRKAIALTGSDEKRNNYQIRRVYAVLGRILIAEGNHAEGDALLARYKQTEQRSLGNSATVISDAAASDMKASPLSALPAPPAVFPGARTPGADAAATPATQPASGPTVSAAELSRRAAAEKQLSALLAATLNDLGTAEARLGSYESALAHFQEAEHWGPPTPALLHNLGIAAFRVQNFKESERAIDAFLKLQDPAQRGSAQDVRSRMVLAMSRFSLGRFAEADQAFASIPEAAMQDPRAAYSWGFALARSGKQQQANHIADLLAVQALPSDVMSLVCHLYMDTENYEQSIRCFQNASRTDPALKLAHYQVGESLIRLDRPADAVPELRQEIALSPDNPDVQYALAFALLQSSHKEEAISLLKQLTDTTPTQAQAQYQLGKVLLEQGETDAAIQHLELAEKNDPDSDYTHYQLQAAYRKAGRAADADREARIYREMKSRKRDSATPPK